MSKNRTKPVITALSKVIGKITISLGYVSGVFALMMMFGIGYDVIMRHLFNKPTIWADEVSCYLLVGIAFLGAAYTLTRGGHIYVETLVGKLGPKAQKRVTLLTDALTLIFLVVLTRQAYWLVRDSFVSKRISATLLRTPLFIPQLFIFIGLACLSLQLLIEILNNNFLGEENGSQEKAIDGMD